MCMHQIIVEKNSCFFKLLQREISDLTYESILICGDFNCVLDNTIDIISGDKHNSELVKSFNDFKIHVC